MSRLLFFLLLAGVPLPPARANLGETIQQNIVRYGRPVGLTEANAKTPFGNLFFRAGRYDLVLFILNNQEVGARVSKTDKSAFSDGDLKDIMDAESNGSPWTAAPSNDPALVQWSRSDHATFSYDKDKHLVLLTSDAMVRALHAGHGP